MEHAENQHWVPKFLVKNFIDSDGRVFRLDIKTDVVTKPPPKYAASEVAFNEFEIDGRSISYEGELTKIETKAAPLLKEILASGSLAGCRGDGRRKLADFMAAQSFRTEAFHKGFDEITPRKAFGAVFAQAWRSAFIVADELVGRRWALMEAVDDSFFYLGDNPLVLQRTANPNDGTSLGFDVTGVEAFLPLSPKFALYMPCQSFGHEMIEGFQTAEAIERGEPTTELGRALSRKILTEHAPLYDALTTGVPFVCRAENVENLNYLQCSWAHSALYSHKRDFDFALRVFRETPQYRKAPRVSMTDMGSRG
jgi:Protein of unknown function (DUF4238)